MYDIIGIIVTNFFRLFVLRRFFDVFFDKKNVNIKNQFVLYACFYLATTINSILFHKPIVNIITNLIGLYLLTQIYSASQAKKILVALFCYSINMVCDIFSVFVVAEYSIGENYNYISIYITVILIIICQIIIEKIVNSKEGKIVESPYWKILLFIPIFSIFMLYFMLSQNLKNRYFVILFCIGILIINIIIFYLYNSIVDNYIRIQENEIFKRQTEIYSNQLKIHIQTENKIRSLQHDLKNHMQELYHMAQQGETGSIVNYIEQMYRVIKNPKEYCFSGNKEIDGIINYMIEKSGKALKDIQIDVQIPEYLKVSTYDMNVLLGNLLENAIDAAIKTEEKFLKLVITFDKGILYIYIINSYAGEIRKKSKKIITTKKDEEQHGYGLENVRKIVETYNGTLDINYDSNRFEVNVMLYTLKLQNIEIK